MTVYRLEKHGLGPYARACVRYSRLDELNYLANLCYAHGDDKHPELSEDFDVDSLGYLPSYFCGFDSLSKLYEWFDGFLDKLIEYGFEIKTYEVDDVISGISGRQLIFQKPA